jgi:peroxiredoxin Q/BCP
MTSIGEPYPPFALPDHSGATVSSAELAGRWYLLYWYPKADTPGCTAQAQGLRDQIQAFDELGCRILGASFDEPADNEAFRQRYGLPFALLSDTDGGLARAVGAADEGSTHPRRVAHLVDPTGSTAKVYDVEDPEFFAEAVLDDLEDLIPEG